MSELDTPNAAGPLQVVGLDALDDSSPPHADEAFEDSGMGRERAALWRRIVRNSRLRGALLPIAFLGLWAIVSMAGLFPGGFLPTPAQVASGWWTWAFGPTNQLSWTSGTFFPYCLMSMERVFLGFGLGAAFGLSLGVLIGWYKLASDLMDPMVQILRPIPMTAWLPFATLLFGIQEAAGIALIAMGCFFPIVLNTTSGARQTPQLLVRAALMLGTKPRRLPLRIVIPAALPSIVTGLRLGLGLAWVLVIVAEIVAVRGGLGYAIWGAYEFLRTDLIIAAIITLGFLGWVSDLVLQLLSRRLMRWQRGLVH